MNTVLIARAEASAWMTRLHGPHRSPELEAGLRQWLAERPENAQEFEGLSEVWDLVAHESVSRRAPRLERWEHPKAHWRWGLAAAAVAIVAAGALFYFRDPRIATAIGEQRMVRLEDGTRVSLNSNTRMEVKYGGAERRIRLERGEAFFEVARDTARPFVVTAGERTVTALATSFVVRYDAGQTAVTLVEGKVAVSAAADKGMDVLGPGERVTFLGNSAPKKDSPRIEVATAWRRGEVILDDTSLADAVAEMNRYDKATIAIDDPAIAGLIVSGLYHTGDSEGFARSVARMYGLRMDESSGRIRLRK